jgi:HAD superfamily hydrolase (TIGR01490 family)
MKRLAIFDFCGTLVNFQTANAFVDFVTGKQFSKQSLILDFIWKLLINGKLLPPRMRQRFKLLKLRGFKLDKLKLLSKEFVDQKLIPNENKIVVNRLKQHKKQGDIIIIISGAYNIYLKIYGKRHFVDHVIATKIASKNNKLTGKIFGQECVGKNKLVYLKKIIKTSKFDLINSFVYTDNYFSDKPLLEIVGNRFLVKNKNYSSVIKKYHEVK